MNALATQPMPRVASDQHQRRNAAHTHRSPANAVAGRFALRSPPAPNRVSAGRVPHSCVRIALEVGRAKADALTELPTAEACLAALKLGWHPVEMKGDKIALVLRSGGTGAIVGVAICARPCHRHYDDGLTVELRCLVARGNDPASFARLGIALGKAAIRHGYRRLLVRDECTAGLTGLAGSWVEAGGEAAPPARRLANVLRGDGYAG